MNDGQKTILLIEDDQILLRMYNKKFANEDFEVLVAADGEEGLKILEAASPKPNIILADVMLPKMNGFEFLEKCKQNEATKNIPVILLTNLGGGEYDREKGKTLGAADYLVKSEITPSQIISKVKNIIEHG